MRILGLTPCFFPVCEGLEGGWDPGCVCRRRRRAGGDPRMWGETLEWEGGPLEWDGEPLEWEGETLEWDGESPRMGGGPPRMGGGTPRIGWGRP